VATQFPASSVDGVARISGSGGRVVELFLSPCFATDGRMGNGPIGRLADRDGSREWD